MEISSYNHVKEIVTGIWWNGAPVDEVYLDGEKLYPLEGTVATQILIDVTPDAFADGLNYWLHALDWHDSQIDQVGKREEVIYPGRLSNLNDLANWVNWSDKMKKQGYTIDPNNMILAYKEPTNKPVSLFTITIGNKTYKEGTDFTFNQNTGLISFTGKQLPELSALPVGSKIKLSATVPQRKREKEIFQAKQNTATSKTFSLPLLPDTKFYFYYYKGQKKVSAGTRLTVVGVPSNTEFYYGKGQRNGHGRGDVTGIVPPGGTGWDQTEYRSGNKWTKGDLQFKITISPFNNSSPKSYPIYPAFTKEWSLTVLGVVIKQL